MTSLSRRLFNSDFYQELRTINHLVWPIALTRAGELILFPVVLMFAGHLGKTELAAVSLSTSIVSTCYAIIYGLESGCGTIFSQAFGYGDRTKLGLHLQKSIILYLLILLICYAFLINIGTILKLSGQDPEIAWLTGQYTITIFPAIFFNFLYSILKLYTQCQNVVLPHIINMVVVNLVHVLIQYLLYHLKFGLLGCALGFNVAYGLLFLFTLMYTIFSEAHKETWTGWTTACLTNWWPMVKLCIFGVIGCWLEYWAFDLTVILSGFLGTVELSAQAAAFNIDALFYGISNGICVATLIRVGHFLGAGSGQEAKIAARVATTLAIANGCAIGIFEIACRHLLAQLMTNDIEITSLVASLLPFVAFYTLADNVIGVGRGIYMAIGWQFKVSVILFIGYYIIGTIVGIPLVFCTSLGIYGFWVGFLLAMSSLGIFFLIHTLLVLEWETTAKKVYLEQSNTEYQTEASGILSSDVSPTEDLIQDELQEEVQAVTLGVILGKIAIIVTCIIIFLSGVITRVVIVPRPNEWIDFMNITESNSSLQVNTITEGTLSQN